MGVGMMAESFRAGQPTNAAVIRKALAMTPILRINDRLFMNSLPPPGPRGERYQWQREQSIRKPLLRFAWQLLVVGSPVFDSQNNTSRCGARPDQGAAENVEKALGQSHFRPASGRFDQMRGGSREGRLKPGLRYLFSKNRCAAAQGCVRRRVVMASG